MDPHRNTDGYTLNELTETTGVTARTVRYYVSEGLLPPPVAAGPRSYYGQRHLQRLRLIGYMKDAYLPLKEIRRRLEEISDEEVEDAIHGIETERGGSIRDVTQDESEVDSPTSVSVSRRPTPDAGIDTLEPKTWPFVTSRPGEYADPVPEEPAWRLPRPIKAAKHDPHNSTVWRKLSIGESAEFLIEERLYLRRKEQVDALVVWAQRILEGN